MKIKEIDAFQKQLKVTAGRKILYLGSGLSVVKLDKLDKNNAETVAVLSCNWESVSIMTIYVCKASINEKDEICLKHKGWLMKMDASHHSELKSAIRTGQNQTRSLMERPIAFRITHKETEGKKAKVIKNILNILNSKDYEEEDSFPIVAHENKTTIYISRGILNREEIHIKLGLGKAKAKDLVEIEEDIKEKLKNETEKGEKGEKSRELLRIIKEYKTIKREKEIKI